MTNEQIFNATIRHMEDYLKASQANARKPRQNLSKTLSLAHLPPTLWAAI